MNKQRKPCSIVALLGPRGFSDTAISPNAKPIPPAINIEPSGLFCTLFAIACEPSRKESPLFS